MVWITFTTCHRATQKDMDTLMIMLKIAEDSFHIILCNFSVNSIKNAMQCIRIYKQCTKQSKIG